jgi:hypothetical protein
MSKPLNIKRRLAQAADLLTEALMKPGEPAYQQVADARELVQDALGEIMQEEARRDAA